MLSDEIMGGNEGTQHIQNALAVVPNPNLQTMQGEGLPHARMQHGVALHHVFGGCY